MIDLTPEQRLAVEQGEPVRVVDSATHDAYVVVRAEVYERLAGAIRNPADEAVSEIPSGVLRSMQAFWRDLPDLLKSSRNQGKWVAYHGEEQVGR